MVRVIVHLLNQHILRAHSKCQGFCQPLKIVKAIVGHSSHLVERNTPPLSEWEWTDGGAVQDAGLLLPRD